jgi:hypothetical protein
VNEVGLLWEILRWETDLTEAVFHRDLDLRLTFRLALPRRLWRGAGKAEIASDFLQLLKARADLNRLLLPNTVQSIGIECALTSPRCIRT